MFVDNIVRGTGAHFECLECRAHAVEHMTKTDPIKNILALPKTGPNGTAVKLMVCSAWTYRFHEAVNDRLKKSPSQRPTFTQHEQYLADLREGKGCSDCGSIGEVKTVPLASQPTRRKIRRQIID